MSEARRAYQAIDESKSTDSIVTIAWSDVVERDLYAECEDTADRGQVIEFWGRDDEGRTWRVHLEGIRRWVTMRAEG